MFQANIGSIGSTSHTNGEGSRSNKRNSTEIHFGKTDNTSELNTSNQNFCSGVSNIHTHTTFFISYNEIQGIHVNKTGERKYGIQY